MKSLLLYCLLIISGLAFMACQKEDSSLIRPGEIWKDTDGNPINAHGGGVLYDKGTYYWFGEYKKGKTWRVDYIDTWECYRVNAGGVSCYSSQDLVNWKFEGLVLPSEKNDSTHDLHISKVIERPKVIYNDKTKKYVMWMHVDSEDYSYARAGVAISDTPTGPYQYLGSVRPNGQMSRDMTLFKDDDGKAYLIYSSEDNLTTHISQLSDDYLQHTGNYIRVFANHKREAPAIVKHQFNYYIINSGCTGWSPNPALYAMSDAVMGNWQVIDNPCTGEGSQTTFKSQSTFILPVAGKEGSYIYMGDRWNKTDLEDSRYVWLPLIIEDGKMVIRWQDEWSPGLKEKEGNKNLVKLD